VTFEEGQELLVAVAGFQRAGDLAGGDVQGGEQGAGAVADGVVRAAFDQVRLHRARDRPTPAVSCGFRQGTVASLDSASRRVAASIS
jgi:hypothetical protein